MTDASFGPKNGTNSDFVSPNGKQIVNIAKNLLPVLVLAALLPVFYGFAVNPPDFSFYSKAEGEAELRLWFDPANTITQAGEKVELTVYGEYEGEGEIPAISFGLNPDSELSTDKTEISRLSSFSGKAVLGKVFVDAQIPGQYKLSILESEVEITGLDDPIEISAAPANFIVR